MNHLADQKQGGGGLRFAPLGVFAIVLIAQLALVAAAGTDVPFYDQWDVEGWWLYPGWMDGSIGWLDLARAHNEHRIVWTHLLNLGLFEANGRQWDPLVQMVAGAGLHAGCAAVLCWLFAGPNHRGLVGAVILLSLPLVGWHNALWGFQSQFYFMELFVLLAFAGLAEIKKNNKRVGLGVLAVIAACLAMGAGQLVPLALLGGWGWRVWIGGMRSRRLWMEGGGLLLMVIGVWWLRPLPTEPNALQAGSLVQFLIALTRLLAWPHVGQPGAVVVMNSPWLALLGLRLARRGEAAVGEGLVVTVGLWTVLAAGAAAWTRGGGLEFSHGVPSRYADFIALLPLVNIWCATVLLRELTPGRLRLGRLLVGCWLGFFLVGWLGLSAEMWRKVVLPRSRDVDAPGRLIQAFQRTGAEEVFAGQPRLLVPHPDLDSVRRVLTHARLQDAGALPPSLQPDKPMGPLSRASRRLLGRVPR